MKSFLYGAAGSVFMLIALGWLDAWMSGQAATHGVWAAAVSGAFFVAYMLFERASETAPP